MQCYLLRTSTNYYKKYNKNIIKYYIYFIRLARNQHFLFLDCSFLKYNKDNTRKKDLFYYLY